MAAKVITKISIEVTNGDAIMNNKYEGKSNTGTYFVSSGNDFNKYKMFFEKKNAFLDITKVHAYYLIMKSFYSDEKELYVDKMKQFDDYCWSLINLNFNPSILYNLRINDSRYFMKFDDNNDIIIQAFRKILYGEKSLISIELKDNTYYIYPEINFREYESKLNIINREGTNYV